MRRLMLWLLPVAVYLTGCGNDNTTTGDNQVSYQSDQKDPVKGDWVIVHHNSDPDGLNPVTYRSAESSYIISQMFQSLLEITPDSFAIAPLLAKSRPVVSEDGMKFTYEIREDATWDNGSPITGYDYAFSVKVIKNPKVDAQQQRPYLESIEDVVVDPSNPKKFDVIINKKYFRAETSTGLILVIPQYLYDPGKVMDKFTITQLNKDADKLVTNPDIVAFAESFNSPKFSREKEFIAGSGPYKLDEWVTGQKVSLIRKDNWWGDKQADWNFQAFPVKLVYKTINDAHTAVVALISQELDVLSGIQPKDFQDMKNNPDVTNHYNLTTPPTFSYGFVAMNCNPPSGRKTFFKDVNIRRAMAHLFDVNMVIDKVYYGMATRTVGPISPLRKSEYNGQLQPIAYDPKKASDLLDAAGWKDSDGDGIRDKVVNGSRQLFEFEFLIPSGRETTKKVALIFQEECKKSGIKLNITEQDFNVMIDRCKKHDFDMYLGAWTSPALPSDLKQIWHSTSSQDGGSNYISYANAEVDKLIDQIRLEMNEDARTPMYHKLQELIYQDQPYIFVHSIQEKIAIHKRFRNAETDALRPGFREMRFWAPVEFQKYK